MSDAAQARETRWDRWLPAIAAAAFLIHAINYLYFFVDDEGITLQYAQNLLRGRGLTYSAFEGPTEGYSNLLHVLVNTGFLALVHALGLPKISVFALGKTLSLLSGAAMVWMVGAALRQLLPRHWRAQVGGLAVLALAGPVAVWSCSSLETVPFAAIFTAFLMTVVFSPTRVRLAVTLGVLTILARVDGFVYVGVAGCAALMVRPAGGRWLLLRRTAPALLTALAAYTAWRWWYFGSVLSLPLQTKLLYKLLPVDGLVVNVPPVSYARRFANVFDLPVMLPLCLGWLTVARWHRDRRPFALLLTAALLAIYVSSIGDWMFGFRFFTTLFPLVALLAALTLAELSRRAPRLGTVALLVVIGWTAGNTREFITAFHEADRLANWRSWWADPSFEEARFFAPYYPLYRDLKDRVAPGTLTVNNQAGFLPFMLDLENIDDLGITSRFFATLPTADVTFTEVGRYHALTTQPPLRAGVRYLLHRRPRYVMSWRHLIANANGTRTPPELLDGHFRLVMESAFQVVYERTGLPSEFGAEDFLENLAHPARYRRASIDGSSVPRAAAKADLPFLVADAAAYPLPDPLTVEVHLDGSPVHELWIDRIQVESPATLTLTVHGPAGQPVFRDTLAASPGRPLRYHRELEHKPAGAVFTLVASPTATTGGKITISDLRVLGQPSDLREHVERELFDDQVRGEDPGAIPPGAPDTGHQRVPGMGRPS